MLRSSYLTIRVKREKKKNEDPHSDLSPCLDIQSLEKIALICTMIPQELFVSFGRSHTQPMPPWPLLP